MFEEIKNFSRPKCGEIWMCNLPYLGGSVQNGYRPVFILSNDKNNTYSPTINVIPLTTKMNKRNLPVHVELWNYRQYGLKAPSTMLVEQIMSISVQNFDRCVGEIKDKETLNLIWKAIGIQFPILDIVDTAC